MAEIRDTLSWDVRPILDAGRQVAGALRAVQSGLKSAGDSGEKAARRIGSGLADAAKPAGSLAKTLLQEQQKLERAFSRFQALPDAAAKALDRFRASGAQSGEVAAFMGSRISALEKRWASLSPAIQRSLKPTLDAVRASRELDAANKQQERSLAALERRLSSAERKPALLAQQIDKWVRSGRSADEIARTFSADLRKLESRFESLPPKIRATLEPMARLAQEQRNAANAARNLEAASGGLLRAGTAITAGVTLPLTAAAAASVKFGGDFDKALTESTAIMGKLTAAMRKDMAAAAKEVAAKTKFFASEAAEAYFFLASAGLDAAASIKALPVVASFAQAGTFDLAKATDLLTDAQSALGLTIRDDVLENMRNMTRVADVLVKANTLANASVEQFSKSLTTKAGARLRLFNQSIEDGVAILAAWADQGVKAEQAGERLDIVMRDLSIKGFQNREAFKKLGVEVFDAQGAFRNIVDVVEELDTALGGMSDAQKTATLLQLGFTQRNISAVSSLFGLSKAIRRYQSELRQAGGTTEEVAENQLEAFNNKMLQLWGLVQNVAIDAFESTLEPILTGIIIPALEAGVEALQEWVDWFGRLPGPVKGAAVALAAIAASIGPIIAGLGAFGLAVAGIRLGLGQFAATAKIAAPTLSPGLSSSFFQSAVSARTASAAYAQAGASLKAAMIGAKGAASSFVSFLGGPMAAALQIAAVAIFAYREEIGKLIADLATVPEKNDALIDSFQSTQIQAEKINQAVGFQALDPSAAEAAAKAAARSGNPMLDFINGLIGGSDTKPIEEFNERTLLMARAMNRSAGAAESMNEQLRLKKITEEEAAHEVEFLIHLERERREVIQGLTKDQFDLARSMGLLGSTSQATAQALEALKGLDEDTQKAVGFFNALQGASIRGQGVTDTAALQSAFRPQFEAGEFGEAMRLVNAGLLEVDVPARNWLANQAALAAQSKKTNGAFTEQDEKLKKLRESFEESIRPAEAFLKKLAEARKAGISEEEFVLVNATDIAAAGKAQEEYGQKVSEAAQALIDQANVKAGERLKKEFEEALDPLDALEKRINELAGAKVPIQQIAKKLGPELSDAVTKQLQEGKSVEEVLAGLSASAQGAVRLAMQEAIAEARNPTIELGRTIQAELAKQIPAELLADQFGDAAIQAAELARKAGEPIADAVRQIAQIRIQDQLKAALDPAQALRDRMALVRSLGVDLAKWSEANKDQILAAAEAMKALGKEIPPDLEERLKQLRLEEFQKSASEPLGERIRQLQESARASKLSEAEIARLVQEQFGGEAEPAAKQSRLKGEGVDPDVARAEAAAIREEFERARNPTIALAEELERLARAGVQVSEFPPELRERIREAVQAAKDANLEIAGGVQGAFDELGTEKVLLWGSTVGNTLDMIGGKFSGLAPVIQNLSGVWQQFANKQITGSQALGKTITGVMGIMGGNYWMQSLGELALGIAALTPWGAAQFGPAPPHFLASAQFAAAAAFGKKGGGGKGGGKGGGGGGGASASGIGPKGGQFDSEAAIEAQRRRAAILDNAPFGAPAPSAVVPPAEDPASQGIFDRLDRILSKQEGRDAEMASVMAGVAHSMDQNTSASLQMSGQASRIGALDIGEKMALTLSQQPGILRNAAGEIRDISLGGS